MTVLDSRQVSLAFGPTSYCIDPPYSPPAGLPEYPFSAACSATNDVYLTVRESLHLLGLDADHFGTSFWNPLDGIINPGDTVVIKPNFVREFRETADGHGDCLITHGAVIRAVTDYVYLALKGRGRIVVADAPHNDANFDALVRLTGLSTIQAFYHDWAGFNVEFYDLRPDRAVKIDGIIVDHRKLAGDPAGYTVVNLADHSMFTEVNHLAHLLYGSEYDTSEVRRHHNRDRHEYLIAATVLNADVVIGVPKLKTHKKTGLTVNLKNLVGINGNKNWLPHHREGTPAHGGDQFPTNELKNRVEQRMVSAFKRLLPFFGPLRQYLVSPATHFGTALFGSTNTNKIRSGNWHGNDTTWRMTIDLNRILFYADREGRLHKGPLRRFFYVVDGIVAGEGNGPLDPSPRPTGVILAGGNPLAVDLVCARLMGFDSTKLPLLHRATAEHPLPLATFNLQDVTICSNRRRYNASYLDLPAVDPPFKSHFGWKGHIERKDIEP